jgi:hypothetical protein
MLWFEKRQGGKLVICPKAIKQDWIEAVEKSGQDIDVLTKEEFKREVGGLGHYHNVVVDEALYFFSPLFTKQRSQLTSSLYEYIKKYSPNTLLLTATPISSTP